MDQRLPEGLPGPARRGLASAGIDSLDDLAAWREADLAALHGVGPAAIAPLRAALARAGRTFAPQPPDHEDVVAIDAWIAGHDEATAGSLTALRATLRRVLPHADEGWSFGLPSMVLQGRGVGGYGATSDQCVYAPMSDTVLDRLADEVTGHEVRTRTLRFPPGSTLPVGLVRRLVAARLAELSDVASGHRREYHADGRVKAEGAMKQGELHGPWFWYRSDGSLLRTGTFRDGEKTGTWSTYDRDGVRVG